jgi:hypothetical protein
MDPSSSVVPSSSYPSSRMSSASGSLTPSPTPYSHSLHSASSGHIIRPIIVPSLPGVKSVTVSSNHSPHSHSHVHSHSLSRIPTASALPSLVCPLCTHSMVFSSEYRLLSEKLRDLQYELSQLSQDLREIYSDSETKTVRYLRRSVISSASFLSVWVLLIEFLRAFRHRRIHRGLFGQIFVPVFKSNSLASVLVSSLLYGIQYSSPFVLSVILALRPSYWQRNLSFLFSVSYSILLYFHPYFSSYPKIPLLLNILLNILYIGARYHYLHGLRSFASLRIL